MTLRHKLLLSLLALLLPLVGLGAVAYVVTRDSLQDQARREVSRLSTDRAEVMTGLTGIAESELSSIAGWPDLVLAHETALHSGDRAPLEAAMTAVSTWWSGFEDLAVIEPDGRVSVASSPGAGSHLDAGLVELARSRGRAAGLIFESPDGPRFSVVQPLGGDREGALVVGEVSADFLLGPVLAPTGSEDTEVAVIDTSDEGLRIYRSRPDRGDIGSTTGEGGGSAAVPPPITMGSDRAVPETVLAAVSGRTGAPLSGLGVSGREVFAQAVDVPDTTWVVLAEEDRMAVLAPLVSIRNAVIAAAALAAALGVLLSWLLGRQLARRLSRIRDAADAIGEGDLTRRSGLRSGDEVGRLSETFDRMADTLASDVQRQRQVETQLAHQALHDSLTGLANRAKFMDRLQDALARSSRSGSPVAVLFCDLDNLKAVNDRMGHTAGDDLLIGISERFRRSVRPSDTVARFGGDEFVVLCSEMAEPEDATVVAQRLCRALEEPFVISGQQVNTSASIGIAVGSGAASTPEDLVQDADVAMYRAKEGGKGRYVLHSESVADRTERRERSRAEAQRALEGGQLRLEYQPIIDIAAGSVAGVEALVRWDHPDRGTLAPAEILAQFGDAGLVPDLDRWVITAAVEQLAQWGDELGEDSPASVSVNLGSDTVRSGDLGDRVAGALAEAGLDAERFSVEVSESAINDDPVAATVALDDLHRIGVRIAMDDFGTGHTSVERLGRYPIDTLKIDGSLVATLDLPGGDDSALVASLSLARAMGLRVVAEQVETVAQVRALETLGFDLAQGNLFCGPLDPGGLAQWMTLGEVPGLGETR